jgi:hypothetical protein
MPGTPINSLQAAAQAAATVRPIHRFPILQEQQKQQPKKPLKPGIMDPAKFQRKDWSARQLKDGTFLVRIIRKADKQAKLPQMDGEGIGATLEDAEELAQLSALLRAMKKKEIKKRRISLLEMFQQTLPMD